MRCRRETVDEPVNQGESHRYLADTMYKMGKEREIYQRLVREKLSPTGKKVAMTDMPQMIAIYNGMGGGAAAAIAAVELLKSDFQSQSFLVLAVLGALVGLVALYFANTGS